MLPLRDANPSGTWPVVTVLLIGANAAGFWVELGLGGDLDRFLFAFGVVPARAIGLWQRPEVALVPHVVVPTFAAMFLHGGWLHLLSNLWYLWIFGDNVEDRLGHLRFLGFYLLCGVAAAAAQVWASPTSTVPVIGASGAIAGVLGAYLVCYPMARITTVVPIFFFIQFVRLPAFVVLVFWFVLQFFNGALAIAAPGAAGGIAWWAHIGGFVAGVVLVRLFPRRTAMRQVVYRSRW